MDQSIITLCVLKLNLTLTHSALPFCGSVNYHTMCSETDSLSLAFLWISHLWHYVLKLNLTLTGSVSDDHRNKHLTLAKVLSKLIWSFRLSVYYPASRAHRFHCHISADQRKKNCCYKRVTSCRKSNHTKSFLCALCIVISIYGLLAF